LERDELEGKSTIDETLANCAIRKWALLAENHGSGSYQEVIASYVDVDKQNEGDHQWSIRWKLAAMTHEEEMRVIKLWM
jgi:hypothetical protein